MLCERIAIVPSCGLTLPVSSFKDAFEDAFKSRTGSSSDNVPAETPETLSSCPSPATSTVDILRVSGGAYYSNKCVFPDDIYVRPILPTYYVCRSYSYAPLPSS